jgi:hypothetical protein
MIFLGKKRRNRKHVLSILFFFIYLAVLSKLFEIIWEDFSFFLVNATFLSLEINLTIVLVSFSLDLKREGVLGKRSFNFFQYQWIIFEQFSFLQKIIIVF